MDSNMLEIPKNKNGWQDRCLAPNDQTTRGAAVTAVWQTAVQIVLIPSAPAMGACLLYHFFGKQVMRTHSLALLLIKAGDVETNPGPTTTRKQVWIFNICHRQIHGRKQI